MAPSQWLIEVYTGMRRIFVIANCHCLPISESLSLCARDIEADFIDLNDIERPDIAAKIDRLLSSPQEYLVFSFDVSEKFHRLSTAKLRPIFRDRLVTFSNLHFAGLHPDITYFGAMGNRFAGFFGDYHSIIISAAYALGYSPKEVAEFFRADVFYKLGYFERFQASAEELRRRDQNCDVRFAEAFIKFLRARPSLYTMNHPTAYVMQQLARTLCKHVGIDFVDLPECYMINHLASNYIWPIHNEIAEHHGLGYRVPQFFVRERRTESRCLDLNEVISGFYASYAMVPMAEFRLALERSPFYSRAREAFSS